MRAQQHLEAAPLVVVHEAVQDDRVLPHVRVHEERRLGTAARRHQDGCRRRGDGHAVPHAPDVDDHLAFAGPHHHRSTKQSDHVVPSLTSAASHGPAQRHGCLVADRQRQRVGHVGRAVDRRQAQDLGDHALHLVLGGGPVADQAELHLVRRVLDDVAATLGGDEESQPAGLTHRHRGLGVDLEKDPLDHDGLRSQLLDQRSQLRMQDQEPLGQGRRRIGLDHPGSVGPQRGGALGPVHEPVAAA